ncbi:MAG TPA: hypothetical protein VFC19_49480 [Candidatus Limnocylindrales bacterium]|nr:hypothetical protein [Candidatus Limnocylindrales bacterium]
MPSIETVIATVSVASMVAVVGGATGILHQLAGAGQPHHRRVPWRARYRRGRHQAARPPLLARLVDAYLAGAREMAHAHALLKGVQL